MKKFYSKHFELEKINDGIYAAIAKEGGGAVGNAGLIDLGDQAVVFDTFNTQQAAEDLLNMTKYMTNSPISWVVNSHWHGDHMRGNQIFKDSKIVSSEMTYERMKEHHPARIKKQKDDLQGLTNYINTLEDRIANAYDLKLEQQVNFLKEIQASLPTLELVLPQHTFKNEFTFHGKNRMAKLFTLGGGHSYCDSILYLPEEKVMFLGDLLFVDSHPTFFEESKPGEWIHILKTLEGMDIQTAVPGHGAVGTKNNLVEIIDYIGNILKVAANWKGTEEIQMPTKYQHWPSPEIYQQNVRRIKELALC